MANLDLEEQEQLDQIKHFWQQYGNAITWVLLLTLTAFASWSGYNYWQRSQASSAAALFDEVERTMADSQTAQAEQAQRVERVFSDMKSRFAGTTYAWQSGLLVASYHSNNGNPEAAKAALIWVVEQAKEPSYQAIAKLRLSALLMDDKDLAAAMRQLEGNFPPSFAPLVADRQGDILALQGNKEQAIAAYQKAYRLFDGASPYRNLLAVKLAALGVNVEAAALAGSGK